MATVTLWCAVYGEAKPFRITIALTESVLALQDAIHLEKRYRERFVASELTLYVAQKNSKWLKDDDDTESFLKQGVVDTTFTKMRVSWKLAKLFSAVGADADSDIHVLVSLPKLDEVGRSRLLEQAQGGGVSDLLDEGALSKKRAPLVMWHREPNACPQLTIADNEQFVKIPYHYLDNSGLKNVQSGTDLWLYRRAPLREQWNEIDRDSIESHARLWIVGAPGSGKSCAAYAFACGKVDRREWDVLWLHLSSVDMKDRPLAGVKFEGDTKSTCILPLHYPLEEIESVLASFSSTRKLIVFMDGYVDNENACTQAWRDLVLWQMKEPSRRRLVNITSMVSGGKDHKLSTFDVIDTEPEKPSRQNGTIRMRVAMLFELASWKLVEYKAAINDDNFFQSVERALRPPGAQGELLSCAASREEREKLIDDKFFVAGGSARMMFSFTMEEAKRDIQSAIKAVTNPEALSIA